MGLPGNVYKSPQGGFYLDREKNILTVVSKSHPFYEDSVNSKHGNGKSN